MSGLTYMRGLTYTLMSTQLFPSLQQSEQRLQMHFYN